MNDTVLTLIGFLVITLVLTPRVICALKGKWVCALFPFIEVFAIVGTFRLALPDSWWARRFYDREKLGRASGRFPPEEAVEQTDDELAAAWDGVEINEAELDPITRRALKKAGRIR